MSFFTDKLQLFKRQHRLHRKREEGGVLALTPCGTISRKRSCTNSCKENELASGGQQSFQFEGPKDTVILFFSYSCLCSDI